MTTLSIWVEILPTEWPSWRVLPYSARIGRVYKRRPKKEELRHFTEIEIEVDLEARYGPKRGVAK